jgi:rRNA maturation endonuclease Nob1
VSALFIGVALAVGALLFVLYPLLRGAPSAKPPADAAEEAVRRYRQRRGACPTCGPRPEPDAVFCSSCGRYLPGACPACGARVTAAGARFCPSCGSSLAA